MNPNAFEGEHSGNRPAYHRYCHACGWGFTARQWRQSAFCPKCGGQVQARRSRATRSPRTTADAPPAPGRPVVETPENLGVAWRGASADRDAARMGKFNRFAQRAGELCRTVTDQAVAHPLRTGVVGMGAGAASMIAGVALLELALPVSLIGGFMAIGGGLVGFLGLRNGQPGMKPAADMGIRYGVGTVLAGLGCAVGGMCLLYGGAAVALGGAGLAVKGALQEHQRRRKRTGNGNGARQGGKAEEGGKESRSTRRPRKSARKKPGARRPPRTPTVPENAESALGEA